MKKLNCQWVRTKPRKSQQDHVLETTLAIIKPDGMPHRKEIMRTILKAGFHIIQRKMIRLTPEQASDFYKDKYDLKAYNLMVFSLSEGPIEALCLAKENCIDDWKCLMGPEKTSDAILCHPETIRGMFGTCVDDQRNVVHGSENKRYARFEIHYFFPNSIVEPVCRDDASKLCCETLLMSTLMDGLYQVTVERPFDPVTWLARWLLENNSLKPIITDTSEKIQAKITELEKMSNVQKEGRIGAHGKAYTSVSSSSIMSSSVSCLCSCESPTSSLSEPAPNNVHDKSCSCGLLLHPKDVTFCPVCHKTMKFDLTTANASHDDLTVVSSVVVTGTSSSNMDTQTESSSSSCIEAPNFG